MPRTKLPWSAYKPKAEELKNKGFKPAEIKQKLGDPYWDGKPWHIKSDGRGGISRTTLESRQQNRSKSNAKRAEISRLNPPQDREERNANRRQNYQAKKLRKQGLDAVIDHVVDLKLLRETVEGMSPEEATAHIKKLEEAYGPLGNRPGNRQILLQDVNEIKRQQSKAVQDALNPQNFLEWAINDTMRKDATTKGKQPPPRKPQLSDALSTGMNLAADAGGLPTELAVEGFNKFVDEPVRQATGKGVFEQIPSGSKEERIAKNIKINDGLKKNNAHKGNNLAHSITNEVEYVAKQFGKGKLPWNGDD